MNSAIDQKLSFCNGGICDISWGHYKGGVDKASAGRGRVLYAL